MKKDKQTIEMQNWGESKTGALLLTLLRDEALLDILKALKKIYARAVRPSRCIYTGQSTCKRWLSMFLGKADVFIVKCVSSSYASKAVWFQPFEQEVLSSLYKAAVSVKCQSTCWVKSKSDGCSLGHPVLAHHCVAHALALGADMTKHSQLSCISHFLQKLLDSKQNIPYKLTSNQTAPHESMSHTGIYNIVG